MRILFSLVLLAAVAPVLASCAHSRYAPYDNGYDSNEAAYERAFSERAAARQREAARRWANVSRKNSTSERRVTSSASRSQTAARRDAPTVYRPPPETRSQVAERPPAPPPISSQPPARPATPPTTDLPVPGLGSAAASRSAAATAAPAEQPDDEAVAAAARQMQEGYRLLKAGFVKKARERFAGAMKAAPGPASLAMARTMDPTFLKTVAFPDVEPDVAQARRYYRLAMLRGEKEARVDRERLERSLATASSAEAPIQQR